MPAPEKVALNVKNNSFLVQATIAQTPSLNYAICLLASDKLARKERRLEAFGVAAGKGVCATPLWIGLTIQLAAIEPKRRRAKPCRGKPPFRTCEFLSARGISGPALSIRGNLLQNTSDEYNHALTPLVLFDCVACDHS